MRRVNLSNIDWNFDGGNNIVEGTVVSKPQQKIKVKVMDIIEQLEFKYRLNKALRQGRTFEELFTWPDFTQDFERFMRGRIGQIWMKSQHGWEFARWQQS